jgi:hypothetical protein
MSHLELYLNLRLTPERYNNPAEHEKTYFISPWRNHPCDADHPVPNSPGSTTCHGS